MKKIVLLKRILEWILEHHKAILTYATYLIFFVAFLKKTYMVGNDDDVPDVPSGWVVLLLALQGIAVAGKGIQSYIGTKFVGGNSDSDSKSQ